MQEVWIGPNPVPLFTVSEGWGPLRRFPDVPEPTEPFPNLNDRAAIKKVIVTSSRAHTSR
ncbi:sulfotransferase [Dokdonella sp.]|uniref:sulfotransferase n=1 Tax=Dokdonella sp. TaxID=2291710 RepID=UPI0039C89694